MRKTRFDIKQFEYLRATDTMVLVRVAGRWRGKAPEACALIAVARDGATRLEALPPVPTAGGDDLWRAAYSAPLALVEQRSTRFSLETGHDRVALPRPGERGTPSAAPAPAPKQDKQAPKEPKRSLVARRRQARLKAMAARGRDSERALSHERAARIAAERTAERERARFETAAAEVRDSIARASVERGRFLRWIEEGAAERARLEHELTELRRQAEEAHTLAAEAGRAESHARAELDRVRAATAEAETSAHQAEHEARLSLAQAQADAESARAAAEDRMKALRKADRRLAGMRQRLERELRRRVRVEAELRSVSAREGRLVGELDRARSEAQKLRTRVGELESAVALLRSGFEQGERKLAAAERDAEAMKVRLAEVAFQPSAGAPDLEALRPELERRAGRLDQLERQAAALRNAIRARMATRSESTADRELAAAT